MVFKICMVNSNNRIRLFLIFLWSNFPRSNYCFILSHYCEGPSHRDPHNQFIVRVQTCGHVSMGVDPMRIDAHGHNARMSKRRPTGRDHSTDINISTGGSRIFVWGPSRAPSRRCRRRGVEFVEGSPLPQGSEEGLCPLPRKFLGFFASELCILRAFWHMIGQFTTPVLIRLKPAKSSDIVTKPFKVFIILRIRNLFMTSANYFGN